MINSTSNCEDGSTFGLVVNSLGTIFSSCVFLVSIFIIVTIWRTPALHSNTNWYIASTCVVDILAALTMLMREIAFFTANRSELTDKIVDIIMLGMTYSSPVSLAIHLAVIAIDRYIYILKPFHYMKHITRPLIIKLLVFVWTGTFIYLITPALFYRDNKFHVICILKQPPFEYYMVAIVVCCVVFVTICFSYFRIAKVAFDRKKAKIARIQTYITVTDVNSANTNSNAAMKSVRFFVAMCGTFIFSYVPTCTFILITMFVYDMSKYVFVTNMFCFSFHSLANFCIYLNMNKDFREGVKKQCPDCVVIYCKRR